MQAQSSKIRNAIFMSVGDIFLSAGALILTLIIISSAKKSNYIEQYTDFSVDCEYKNGDWNIVSNQGTEIPYRQWIESLENTELLIKVGLKVEKTEIECYSLLRKAVREHNISLTKRGKAKTSISIIFIPFSENNETQTKKLQ